MQFAYISPRDQLLIIDAASAKRAEDFLQVLRDTLGSLSVIPLVSKHQPIEVMTGWVSTGQSEAGFELGEEGELRDNADISSVIRCKNQDLAAAEIVNHLKTGMHISKLALNWQQRIEFVLDEKLTVKRLRFSDIVQEQASDTQAEDARAQFDVDFSIMALELSGFIKSLTEAFGGAEDSESATAATARVNTPRIVQTDSHSVLPRLLDRPRTCHSQGASSLLKHQISALRAPKTLRMLVACPYPRQRCADSSLKSIARNQPLSR